jgi:hypothetical protein
MASIASILIEEPTEATKWILREFQPTHERTDPSVYGPR